MKKCIVFVVICLCYSFSTSHAAQLEDIEWSTFIGGSSNEWGRVVAVDSTGNIIFASTTLSSDAVTTTGAYQQTFGGFVDILVRKFSPDGNLLWSTYVGKAGEEAVFTIAIDKDNNIWIGGQTTSRDFPSTKASYTTQYSGGSADALLFKLSSDGKSLLYSTLLGGTAYDAIIGVSCDPSGNVWVSGRTNGDELQCTQNAPQKNISKYYDGFFACINYDYSMRVVSYWGFNHDDSLEDVCVDKQGHPVFIGFSMSQNIEFSGYTFQNVNKGGRDVLLFKLNPNTFLVEWSTLIGGNADDIGYNITVDKDNNIDISGYTSSKNFPVSNNAADVTLGGERDYFVAQFSNDGHLKWNTYLGGSEKEGSDGWNTYHGGIITDKSGNVFVGGSTMSEDFPIGEAYQKTLLGSTDGIIAKFDKSGGFLDGTYIGGTGSDIIHKLVLLNNESIFVSGMTNSKDFPIIGNANDKQLDGEYDAFLVKFGKSKPVDEFSDVIYADKCRTHISVTVNNPAGLTYSVQKKVNCNINLVSNTTTDISLDIEIINTDLWAYWDLEFLSSNGAKYSIIDSTISLASKNLWEFSTVPVTFNLVPVHSESSQILRVYNNNSTDQFLDSPFLVKNTEFSFDNSQLPKWVKAHDSIDLVVTFKPAYYFNPHYDTLAFDGPCYSNKIPVIGYVPYTDTTGKFTSKWLIDSCGLSKQLTVTSKNKFDYSVVSSDNCYITEISKDSTRIVLNFTAKDPTKIAYWNLLFTDIYGNSFSVIDSLVVSDSYAYYTNESAIKFDTARSLTRHTYKLVIHNISGHTLTLNAPDLAINSLFTFDESQFPISILPYDSVVINLYYLPLFSHHLDTDTLTFHHGCDSSKYIVTGYALPSAFFATIDQSDTCALNKIILLESVYDFHCQVIQAENCRFDTISVAPKKIVYSIIPIDPLKNSYWGIKSTDIYNNSHVFYDSIMASIQLAFKVNTNEISYDTVNSFGPFQKKLRIYNISDIPQTIGLPDLKIGNSYAVDNSIFPLTIPAHDSIDITITYKPLSNYHADFDTLVFRHGCKTTEVALFGFTKILPTFSSTNSLDSCGESNVFIMECDFEFDYKVLRAENCSIIEINKDKNKISLNIVSTNPAAKSYWIIEYKDKYGNCHKVCDSLGISARFTFRAAEHCITYDTVQTAQVYIKTLTLYNDAEVSIVISKPMLRFNTEFSLSSADFPLTIAAHDSAKINIYYAPLVSYRNDHDTLYVLTNCSQINIPLSGFAENTDYTVGTHCGTDVTMTSKPKGYTHNKVEVIPNPVIGSGTIRVDTEGKAKISINIYDESGRKACALFSGEIEKTKTISLDTTDLANGMYIVVTNIDGEIIQSVFFINK